ncbi:MAG: hypothetical protein V4592_12740 [Bacteroidota bacterium]
MKKIKLLSTAVWLCAVILTINSAHAQAIKPGQWRFGIGLEVAKPLGSLNDVSNLGLGLTPRLQYGLSDNLAFTLTSGYYNFFGKTYTATLINPFSGSTTYTVDGKDLGIVPVKAGIKAFFSEGWYLGAEAGAGFETNGTGNVKLDVAPALGYAVKQWEVSGRYERLMGSGTYGFVGLRVAYGFGL